MARSSRSRHLAADNVNDALQRTSKTHCAAQRALLVGLSYGLVAARLRSASLHQLGDGTLAEYYHPVTGAPLGSFSQSWTAAVALDWLLDEE